MSARISRTAVSRKLGRRREEAEGEVMGRPVAMAVHPHCGQGIVDAFGNLCSWKPLVCRSKSYVLRYGGHEQLVIRILEHDPYSLSDLPAVIVNHRRTEHFNNSISLQYAVQVQ